MNCGDIHPLKCIMLPFIFLLLPFYLHGLVIVTPYPNHTAVATCHCLAITQPQRAYQEHCPAHPASSHPAGLALTPLLRKHVSTREGSVDRSIAAAPSSSEKKMQHQCPRI